MNFESSAPLPSFDNNMMSSKVSLFDEVDYIESPSRKMQVAPSFSNLSPPPPSETLIRSTPIATTKAPPTPRAFHGPWKLSNVPVLPKFHHPLEPTHVTILDTSPSTIGERIVSVLKRRSIQADFLPTKAVCISPENVEFRVFIYRNTKNQGIVVEVQRRFGKSQNFFQHVRAILDGARGKKTSSISSHSHGPLLTTMTSTDDNYRVVSLDFVSKMLHIRGAETVGLQTLMALVDSSKMGHATAKQVARLLFTQDVGDKVIELLQDDRYKGMALVILSQVLPRIAATLHRRGTTLIPTLVDYVRSDTAHLAHLACKCLEPLLGNDCDAEIWNVLQDAAKVGDAQHQGLAKEARRCLERLGEN